MDTSYPPPVRPSHRNIPATATTLAPIPSYPPSFTAGKLSSDDKLSVNVLAREVVRTPSPTPSEVRVLAEPARLCDWRRVLHPRRYMSKRGILTLLAVATGVALLVVFLAEQTNIQNALQPAGRVPGGWLIPIAVMLVLSFPPLFGHEIIAVLTGDVWGVGVGFAIIAAGTLLGELALFFVFKYCCSTRGKRLEEKQLKYALYAEVVREGGFKVPIIMRYSIIPGHLTTAVFSTCGMSLWVFLLSAVLSLPKQLAFIYLGVTTGGSAGKPRPEAVVLKAFVIIVTTTVTLLAMRYIHRRVDEVKGRVVYARRKARVSKMTAAPVDPNMPLEMSAPGLV